MAKEHYPDPTADDEAWVVVDLKPYKKLRQPVGLAQIIMEMSGS